MKKEKEREEDRKGERGGERKKEERNEGKKIFSNWLCHGELLHHLASLI